LAILRHLDKTFGRDMLTDQLESALQNPEQCKKLILKIDEKKKVVG
jgi:hypothetical protein